MKRHITIALFSTIIVGCSGSSTSNVEEDGNNAVAVTAPIDCAADPSSVNTVSGAFRYEEIAGADFFWVGDDDQAGLNPVRLKMGRIAS